MIFTRKTRLKDYQAAVRILQVLLRTGPHISLLHSWSYMIYEHIKMIMIQNAPIPKCWGRNASDNSMHHWSLSLLCPTTTLLHTHQTHRHTTHTQSPPSKFTIKGQNYKCQMVSSCSRSLPLCLSQSLYLFQATGLKIRPQQTVYKQRFSLHLYV